MSWKANLLSMLLLTHSENAAGASSKQSSIMHMTLGRVLKPRQLTDAERQVMQQRCSHWSSKLKGTVFKPEVLW